MRKIRFFTTLIFNISIIIPMIYMMVSETAKLSIDNDYARFEGIFAGGFYILGFILQMIAFIPTLIMIIIFLTKKEDGIVGVVFSLIGSGVSAFLSIIAIVPMVLVRGESDLGWLVLLFLATIAIIIINIAYLIIVIANKNKNRKLQNPSV